MQMEVLLATGLALDGQARHPGSIAEAGTPSSEDQEQT
jgi:hypothetical protein